MKFGRYEVQQHIGHGGMGSVYRAYDPRFERDVAVKVLPSILLENNTTRHRFEREARTLAQLEHSAIVPVYDFGEEDGQPYLVMRHMHGGSLHDRLTHSALPPTETATITTRIAAALAVAHQRGIIHRDIKPSNILFDEHGEAFLADFGIAKWLLGQTQLTGNRPIGTPAYMSPEQIEPQSEIDGRADVYALTAVLYQMLTGDPPYQEETAAQLLMAHLHMPVPDLRTAAPELPAALAPVIMRGMAKSAEDRYPTTTDLAAAAHQALQADTLPPTRTVTNLPVRSTAKPRWAWSIVLIAIVSVIAVATAWQPFIRADGNTRIGADGMVQQFVAGGTFQTGESQTQLDAICVAREAAGLLDDEPCNPYHFSDNVLVQTMSVDPFWIDQTEVTNALYRHCVEAEGCNVSGLLARYRDIAYADHPITNVSWHQAGDYCAWAGRKLPTAAQWRKAAYGETQTLFAWGNTFTCEQGNIPGCIGDTVPVGRYVDTPYDMSGNVSEWLRDPFSAETIATWQYQTTHDPKELSDHRFLTGSPYDPNFQYSMPSLIHAPSEGRFPDLGFRCASDLP